MGSSARVPRVQKQAWLRSAELVILDRSRESTVASTTSTARPLRLVEGCDL